MKSRDERIETYYHQSAWDLAERVVDLEDLLNRVAALHQEIPVRTTAGIQSGCSSCESDSMTHPWPCLTGEVLLGGAND
jgi:hypothetical protein